MRLLLVLALVALPNLAHAQPPGWLVESANASAIVAHAADLSTTVRCSVAATCIEANKLLRPFVGGPNPNPKAFFALKMGTAYGSWILKNWLKKDAPWWTFAFAVAETVTFSVIAAHNNQVHEAGVRARLR